MIPNETRTPPGDEKPARNAPETHPAHPPRQPPARDDLDLDLDLEEADEGDRLKEGFTGQER